MTKPTDPDENRRPGVRPDRVTRDTRVVEFARLEVAGYLGRDAAVVQKPEREFVALSIGTTRTWRDAQQQLQQRTLWVKVLAFGSVADALRDLKKGAPVYAAGPLTYDRWDSAEGPRHAPVIRVSERSGEVQAAPMPGGQFARVTLAGMVERDAQLVPRESDGRQVARVSVMARAHHALVVQGGVVEHIAERLKAGHGLHLQGRLELHRWQDGQGRPHERATIVVGGPDTHIRVDRTPLALPTLEPAPRAPAVELAAPEVLRERDTPDHSHD